MADGIQFNTANLDNYAALLERAPDKLAKLAVAAFRPPLMAAKRAQQLDFLGSSERGFRAISKSVFFDEVGTTASGGHIRARLGVRKEGAGHLANIAVYGTFKGGGTHMHPIYHLSKELPKARQEFSKAMGQALTS